MTVTLTLNHWLDADQRVFRMKKKDIHGALKGETGIINGVTEGNKEDIFYMLMFCLCVPQSKAIKAEEAVELLRDKDFYGEELTLDELVAILKGRVRFQSIKAKRLREAKILFCEKSFWSILKSGYAGFQVASDNEKEISLQGIRTTLTKVVDGMGMKGSGHFLRNIGMGGLAILDVHVIDGLKKRGIINFDKLGSSQAEYLETELKMKDYATEVGISLDELDLLLWSQKTGYVFK